ncbi:unnamed protein product [Heterobilharzia americana]|nr:unnamed protein product [Heterobilharzia americana]
MTRKEFLSWIQTKLIELIPWANKLPLHEVFYGPPLEYNPPSDQSIHSQLALSIRRRLNPPLQRCLHQALVNPGIYLQNSQLVHSQSLGFNLLCGKPC